MGVLNMKYAVTGATGKFGRNVISHLTNWLKQDDIIALARDTKKAANVLPQEIEIRKADYTDEKSLEEALKGIDRLLFISSVPNDNYARAKQHLNVVNAAKKTGIKFIAYTSFPHADQAKSPLSADHRVTEQAIDESGIKHSFLRNNWYLENELNLINASLAGNPFVYSAQTGHVGWALEREYAEAAARVLTSKNPQKVYEFAGKSLTFADLAEALTEISSKKFKVDSITDEEYKKVLAKQGIPQKVADMIVMIQTLIRNNELAEETNDLEEVLGHNLVPLKDAIQELIRE